jgi:hypothetical protein
MRLALTALCLTACAGVPDQRLDAALDAAVRAVPVCLAAHEGDPQAALECRARLVDAAFDALIEEHETWGGPP